MQNVFIVGSKGIPGAYGGYETFVDKLTEYHQYKLNLKYHVACKSFEKGEFEYHNARCFQIKVPRIGPVQAIYYDLSALINCCAYIKANQIKNPIIYILACRIGPFTGYFQREIHKLGGKIYINPDGHEWLRAKWSRPVRKYWKVSEQLMVKHSDFIICDSKNIEKYIKESYQQYKPSTAYIAYGAENRRSILSDDDVRLLEWYKEKQISPKSYYLVVGRFVPENNYETMIREFMRSKSKRDFILVTNISSRFLEKLKSKTSLDKDPRIKFVGTVYDQELLMKIRENAYGYLHGHEVGGTNPSLLEALSSTDLNLLLNVGFNKECGEDSALYWDKKDFSLAHLIDKADNLPRGQIEKLGAKAKKRVADLYNWELIANMYERIFLN
ncbi:DUF1972 domain-containing protein [Anaerocolumna sp. AGMB13020]|uniref:beta 1-4 rhamnosyltransferase Cps2T n=1 Tax=Anaerocolumna sp. AGMB13020 TaxID=3081750 RepID=UPI0029552ABD|nr:DUF1972 domain-containing protein [Anaerocolumna sp. AGMB13020]WOO38858.1 DUF1972 domain-containing protein [Anaerocolumna sp. AGMB13020]